MSVISTCDATTDWTTTVGGVLSIDSSDKKEGSASLKNTIASPEIGVGYDTGYDPAGTWDWSAKKHILFWLKCDRASTACALATLMVYDTSANYRLWNLTFAAGEWTAIKLLLSTGDSESGTPPDLALVDRFKLRFKTKDTNPFYLKIDNIWVSRQPYDSSLFMTMDMKL